MTMEEVIKQFAPGIACFVDTLKKNAKFGITGRSVTIADVTTGTASDITEQKCADRFTLMLPYAGQTLTWETLFNANYPSEPPDFIFTGNDHQFRPDIAELKCLCDWDASDHRSLLNVVNELLVCYKRYQLSLLKGSLLEYEYNQLFDECQLDDVELYVAGRNAYSIGPVEFVIRLTVDLSKLQDSRSAIDNVPQNVTESVALLYVTYQSSDGGRVTPRIQLSSDLEQLFGAYELQLDKIQFPSEGCLVDYITAVRSTLSQMVDSIVKSREKRKEFMNAFRTEFGSSIVEFNTDDCFLSFLFVWNDFMFLATIYLSMRFPSKQPTLILQSVYHTQLDETPFIKKYTSYPYSPRWSGAEMAQRMRSFILDTIGEFQKRSVYEGRFPMS